MVFTSESLEYLMELLAAGYPYQRILAKFLERGYPAISRAQVNYYEETQESDINRIQEERFRKIFRRGLSLRLERVIRLMEHAHELEALKLTQDAHGRYPLEKAWRETLQQISQELGQWVTKSEVSNVSFESEDMLAELINSDTVTQLKNQLETWRAQKALPAPEDLAFIRMLEERGPVLRSGDGVMVSGPSPQSTNDSTQSAKDVSGSSPEAREVEID